MRVLIACKYKEGFKDNMMPFVQEQADALIHKGVVVDYFLMKGNGILGYLKNYFPLIREIKKFKPDLVHAHYGLTGAICVLQRIKPVVVTFHNGETLSIVINFISSFAALFANHTIYVAEHIYDLCFFKKKSDYSILPCGINTDNYKIMGKKERILKEIGFNSEKKYILFGGAFSNLRKNYPLLKRAVELLDRDDVVVLEMRGLSRLQVTKLMIACDVFVLPTKSEGSPQALKEAMACNCPIVATGVADIKYLIEGVVGCYICTFEPQDLANKITQALNFGKRTNGYQRIVELGLDNAKVADNLIEIYKRILK